MSSMHSAFIDIVSCPVSKFLYIYLRGQNFKNVGRASQGNSRQLCNCVYPFNDPVCLYTVYIYLYTAN